MRERIFLSERGLFFMCCNPADNLTDIITITGFIHNHPGQKSRNLTYSDAGMSLLNCMYFIVFEYTPSTACESQNEGRQRYTGKYHKNTIRLI